MTDLPPIFLKTTNGLHFQRFVHDVLVVNQVTQHYDIKEARDESQADVIVFGPYGTDIPQTNQQQISVGYICENYRWDGPDCDYLFTVSDQRQPNSQRIQWHGFDPRELVQPVDYDLDTIISHKSGFCNFLYSNPVPYREKFFKELSKYKRIDSPGESMRNMTSIDEDAPPNLSRWEVKRRFLSSYKFTLALENEIFPGYQTEKLYDAMRADSIPIYLGDPNVSQILNEDSMITWQSEETTWWQEKIRDFSQTSWAESQGSQRWTFTKKQMRRARILTRDVRHRWLLSNLIRSIVDRIVELDRDADKYARVMAEPWLRGNTVIPESYSTAAWNQIFSHALDLSGRT
ncbi:MAG: hypothetical protein JJ921_09825 [Pseudomonadales bacterium]|nr:hypothetical protein [Pseudomonadales bacterium]MBO7004755.1 hypothetical protein [Pseudomonadales bacterium]